MPTEKSRYTIIVDDKLLKRIDDFRFENRYPSRSAATLDLIRFGLEALEKKASQGKKSVKAMRPGIRLAKTRRPLGKISRLPILKITNFIKKHALKTLQETPSPPVLYKFSPRLRKIQETGG